MGRHLALAADTQRLVDSGHEEDQLHEARAFDDVAKTVDAVVAGAVWHQQQVRSGDVDKAGSAAARRGIDAAVGTRGRKYAKRGHRDKVSRMDVDFRPRL